jgi:hypothetical protein
VDLDHRIRALEEAHKILLREEEERWRLKSRMLWLEGGDKNTTYFHKAASARRSRKQIWEIEDDSGNLLQTQSEIKSAAHSHFKSFYKAPPAPSLAEQTAVAQIIPYFYHS